MIYGLFLKCLLFIFIDNKTKLCWNSCLFLILISNNFNRIKHTCHEQFEKLLIVPPPLVTERATLSYSVKKSNNFLPLLFKKRSKERTLMKSFFLRDSSSICSKNYYVVCSSTVKASLSLRDDINFLVW